MRKDLLLPGLSLVGGVAGFALRRWQLASAFHPETGLFTHGAPATYALLALVGLLILAVFLSVRGIREGPDDFLPAFICPQSGQMAVLVASALLFLAAGVLGISDGLVQLSLFRTDPEAYPLTYPVALLLGAVLCLPGGCAVLFLGRATYRGELNDTACWLAPFPAAAGLIRLFITHLEHGTEPVLLRYCFPLAAAAFLMLGLYYAAGFLYGRSRRRCALFFSLSGVILGITALADGLSLAAAALTMAYVLAALALSRALLYNCAGLPWPGPVPPDPDAPTEG